MTCHVFLSTKVHPLVTKGWYPSPMQITSHPNIPQSLNLLVSIQASNLRLSCPKSYHINYLNQISVRIGCVPSWGRILRIPLHLWTCETRKQIISFQNTGVGQVEDSSYRHFHSQRGKKRKDFRKNLSHS